MASCANFAAAHQSVPHDGRRWFLHVPGFYLQRFHHCPIMRTPFPPLFFALSLSLLSLHAASAPTIDPLWQKARQALDASKTLVADEVGTEMEMIDGDGKSMGVMHIVERISDWKNAEPVRTIVSNDNPQYAAVARTRFKMAVPDHPEEALRDGDGPQRIGSELCDGKPCAIFRVDGKRGEKTFSSKVWIDEASGLPVRVLHDFAGMPMTTSLRASITFGGSRGGAWLPASAVVDATVHMLFQELRVVSKYTFRSWIPRPGCRPSTVCATDSQPGA